MVDCQNTVCIMLVKLGISAITVYRPPSNSSGDNNLKGQQFKRGNNQIKYLDETS